MKGSKTMVADGRVLPLARGEGWGEYGESRRKARKEVKK
jgi:hypothetical protein